MKTFKAVFAAVFLAFFASVVSADIQNPGVNLIGAFTSGNCLKAVSRTQIQDNGAACGLVASVFGRTGAVLATAGDYAVAQITGAAPLVSPAFTGSPTAPTQSSGDNSTLVATTAFVKSIGYITGNQTITLSSDCSGSGTTAITVICAKINGNAFPATVANNQIAIGTAASTFAFSTVPNCVTGGLLYTQASHTFTCGAGGWGSVGSSTITTGASPAVANGLLYNTAGVLGNANFALFITNTASNPSLQLGTTASSGDDSAIIGTRALTPVSGLINSHFARDETVATQAVTASGFSGYASFDAAATINGTATTPQNHHRDFQSRGIQNSTGTVNEFASFWSGWTVQQGIVAAGYGMHVVNPTILGGSITTFAGLTIDTISGAGTNIGIQVGANPSMFGGTIAATQFLPTINVAGTANAQIDASGQSFINVNGAGSQVLLLGTGYYEIYIAELSVTGTFAKYICGNTSCFLLGGSTSWDAPTNTPALNHYSINYNGSTGYSLRSNNAGNSNFKVVVSKGS